METAIANGMVPGIQSQAREITKRWVLDWFNWIDGFLDIHRSNFVFRQPTPKELEEHKTGLKDCIRTGLLMNTQIADPDFNDPDLAARLQVRIRQLQDAYDTFHDTTFSDEQAEKILRQVFPE